MVKEAIGLLNMPSIWTDILVEEEAAQAERGASSQQDDDESESQIKLTPRVRRQFGIELRTAGDAFQVCKSLFEEQLQRAASERPLPNQSIGGDASARAAFLLLLTDAQKRELFLKLANNSASWPRIRSLVGAPPFHFLLPHDAGVLNATGFARGRINMTYEHSGRAANHSQFGPGQLVDEHTREYRIAPRALNDADPLPGQEYFQRATKDMLLQVKVKRTSIQKKRALFRSQSQKQLFFPQPGEAITLRETRNLLSARGLREPSETTLRVKALWPREQGGNTATVLVGF